MPAYSDDKQKASSSCSLSTVEGFQQDMMQDGSSLARSLCTGPSRSMKDEVDGTGQSLGSVGRGGGCEMRHTIFLLGLTQSSFLQLSRSVSAPAPTDDLDRGSRTLSEK